ncbi:hypothetical protein [Thalassiella azotivora]
MAFFIAAITTNKIENYTTPGDVTPTSRPVPQWTRPGATAVETSGRKGHHH